jgi:hypothetical protein
MPRRKRYRVGQNELRAIAPKENLFLLVWIGRGDSDPATLARRLGEPANRTAVRIAMLSEHGLVDIASDGSCRLAWRTVFSEGGGQLRLDICFSHECDVMITLRSSVVVSESSF